MNINVQGPPNCKENQRGQKFWNEVTYKLGTNKQGGNGTDRLEQETNNFGGLTIF